MKKLILVLAMLVASPVFAALDVNLVLVDSDTVAVVYTGADSANLPRAFALTVTIDGTGTFTAINGYKTGESTSANPGFGIFPAGIQINSAGTVDDYGSPLADTADPGAAGTGLGTNTVILELGSLYSGSANAPLTAGTLCTLDFNKGTATQISLATESTYRGGIVLENGTQLTDTAVITLATPPAPATNGTPTPNVTTATGALNTDLAWTAGAGATSYDVYFGTVNPPPFVGNTSATTYEPGVLVQGKVYYVSVVAKNDAGSAAALSWSFNTECYKSTSVGYSTWTSLGKPNCWCFRRQCRGDGNGASALGKPVTAADLTNFQSGFNLTVAQLTGKVDAYGVPSICGDYNHASALGKPVTAADLTIFQDYFNDALATVPECDSATVNFWTN